MGSIFWPLPVAVGLIEGGYLIANAIMAASRNGALERAFPGWLPIVAIVFYILLEIVFQSMKYTQEG